jgi:hypothetical protein
LEIQFKLMKNQILYFLLFFACLLFSCNYRERNSKNGIENKSFSPENYIGILDSTLLENSGLLLWNNHFWTFNDSGGKNEIYGLDFNTGKILYTIQIKNSTNVDWEDIAQDKNFIYIAETGNNFGSRHDLKIYRIRKKDINSNPFQEITADSISFSFADQLDFTPFFQKTHFDCEALMVINDSLFVFTKDWSQNITKIYGFPSRPNFYNVFPIDSFNVKGLITGADILPNGKYALIGYKNFHSFIWTFQKSKSGFFSNPRFIDLGILENAQTEGVCFSSNGDLFFSCELTGNYHPQIWKIGKNQLY